ncbi:slipin family protein [Candidatus Micrarchaeota archaeon]|nr:slipin family protein [Candidatus Micrarchaeota archaeon]
MALEDILGLCLLPVVFVVGLMVLGSIRVLYQYQKGILFQLGKYIRTVEPGVTLVVPMIQELRVVDMRITTADIPKQEVITKDNIPVLVNTVVYYKVERPDAAVLKIQNFDFAVRQYTQAALRDVVGNNELDFVLTEREKIAQAIKKIVDTETSEWGVDISAIKIQEIELPAEMKRAMAKQAEAERERRAVVISSEGELQASQNLMRAAENLAKSDGALHLRTLQTIRDIAADPSEKIVLFLPSDYGRLATKLLSKKKES